MNRAIYVLVLLLTGANVASAAPADDAPASVRATFLVTGLHCPPCTNTVESSVAIVRGLESIVVDWKTKAATVKFDPALTSVWAIAQRVAETRHMMGDRLHYAAWLALNVPELADEAGGEEIQKSLAAIEGVADVSVYPEQHVVAIHFGGETEVTLEQLIEAVKAVGFAAETY